MENMRVRHAPTTPHAAADHIMPSPLNRSASARARMSGHNGLTQATSFEDAGPSRRGRAVSVDTGLQERDGAPAESHLDRFIGHLAKQQGGQVVLTQDHVDQFVTYLVGEVINGRAGNLHDDPDADLPANGNSPDARATRGRRSPLTAVEFHRQNAYSRAQVVLTTNLIFARNRYAHRPVMQQMRALESVLGIHPESLTSAPSVTKGLHLADDIDEAVTFVFHPHQHRGDTNTVLSSTISKSRNARILIPWKHDDNHEEVMNAITQLSQVSTSDSGQICIAYIDGTDRNTSDDKIAFVSKLQNIDFRRFVCDGNFESKDVALLLANPKYDIGKPSKVAIHKLKGEILGALGIEKAEPVSYSTKLRCILLHNAESAFDQVRHTIDKTERNYEKLSASQKAAVDAIVQNTIRGAIEGAGPDNKGTIMVLSRGLNGAERADLEGTVGKWREELASSDERARVTILSQNGKRNAQHLTTDKELQGYCDIAVQLKMNVVVTGDKIEKGNPYFNIADGKPVEETDFALPEYRGAIASDLTEFWRKPEFQQNFDAENLAAMHLTYDEVQDIVYHHLASEYRKQGKQLVLLATRSGRVDRFADLGISTLYISQASSELDGEARTVAMTRGQSRRAINDKVTAFASTYKPAALEKLVDHFRTVAKHNRLEPETYEAFLEVIMLSDKITEIMADVRTFIKSEEARQLARGRNPLHPSSTHTFAGQVQGMSATSGSGHAYYAKAETERYIGTREDEGLSETTKKIVLQAIEEDRLAMGFANMAVSGEMRPSASANREFDPRRREKILDQIEHERFTHAKLLEWREELEMLCGEMARLIERMGNIFRAQGDKAAGRTMSERDVATAIKIMAQMPKLGVLEQAIEISHVKHLFHEQIYRYLEESQKVADAQSLEAPVSADESEAGGAAAEVETPPPGIAHEGDVAAHDDVARANGAASARTARQEEMVSDADKPSSGHAVSGREPGSGTQQSLKAEDVESVLKAYGLKIPRDGRGQLRSEHLRIIERLDREFEARSRRIVAEEEARLRGPIEHLRGMVNAYEDNVRQKKSELKELGNEVAQDPEDHKSAKKEIKYSIGQSKAGARNAKDQLFMRTSALVDRRNVRLRLLRRAVESLMAGKLAEAGLYVENPVAESLRIDAALRSSRAQEIIDDAVKSATRFDGSVDRNKVTQIASGKLTAYVLDDPYFQAKMTRMAKSRLASDADRPGTSAQDQQTGSAAERTQGAVEGQRVRKQAEARVREAVEGKAAERTAKAVRVTAEQQAIEKAQVAARAAAESRAVERTREAARSAAERQVEARARKAAADAAQRQAEARAQAVARVIAERQAEAKAQAAARAAAERQATERAQAAARAAVEAETVKAFHRRLARADVNLFEARLARATRNLAIAQKHALNVASRQAEALDANGKPKIVTINH